MNWFKDVQNILGILVITIFTALMINLGHDVLGVIQVTDKLIVPVAAIPLALGFVMLKTNIAQNVAELKGAVSGKPPAGSP